MTKYFTKSGDDGFTNLIGKGRVPKYHPKPEALGAIDEANAALGFARALSANELKDLIIKIQRDLYKIMAEIATTVENAGRFREIDDEHVNWLETNISLFSKNIPEIQEFIVPGDNITSAAFSLARTAIRRAERRVSALFHYGQLENQFILVYLNRLSSLCFVLELHESTRQESTNLSLAKGD